MRLAVRAAFGLLVIATFSAFFVAQRLKNSPPVVAQIGVAPFFSPNRDGRFDRARIRFQIKERDDIAVGVLDVRGDEVRRLPGGGAVAAGQILRLRWDGRDDEGRLVPDGRYRYRVTLRREGRSVELGKSVRLDTTPPRPLVLSIGPESTRGPELLPLRNGGEAVVHLRRDGRQLRILLFKTGPGRPRLVDTWSEGEDGLPQGAKSWRWDGTTKDGRPVSPGSYLVAVEIRDQAGNIGVSPALGRDGLPRRPYGATLPGRGGITVRYLAVQPPATPVTGGEVVRFGVDARREPYTWSIRRVGGQPIRTGRKTTAALQPHAPDGASGLFLLQVRTRLRSTTVPFAVQSRERSPVLVVLPTMTWQGTNPVDDDGDGLPNVLDRGLAVRAQRVYGDGLPASLTTREAPLLAWLDRAGHRYDLTTDVALARGVGPKLAGHAGVILAGDLRWLPRTTLVALRRYVTEGGAVASFGVDALRRQVTLSADGVLSAPTPAATTDAFGARLGEVRRLDAPATLVNAGDASDLELFRGTNGAFPGFSTVQELADVGTGAKLQSWAAIESELDGKPVIAAERLGRGLVVRFPLPELPAKLSAASPDPQVEALLERTWMLLSR